MCIPTHSVPQMKGVKQLYLKFKSIYYQNGNLAICLWNWPCFTHSQFQGSSPDCRLHFFRPYTALLKSHWWIQGGHNRRPPRVPVLSFWHTNFTKRSCVPPPSLQGWRLPYTKSLIRHWKCNLLFREMSHEFICPLQCSFTSPACDASPQEVEQFHRLMSKWRKSQETGEVFDCYGGNEKNKHEVLGRLLYTSTIAYLVILIPVSYAISFGIQRCHYCMGCSFILAAEILWNNVKTVVIPYLGPQCTTIFGAIAFLVL